MPRQPGYTARVNRYAMINAPIITASASTPPNSMFQSADRLLARAMTIEAVTPNAHATTAATRIGINTLI